MFYRLKFEHDLLVKNPFTNQTFRVNQWQVFFRDTNTGVYTVIPHHLEMMHVPEYIANNVTDKFVLMLDLDAGLFEEIA